MTTSELPNNAEIAWSRRWKSLLPSAEYHHDWGLEGAWRQNADVWGYPLSDQEEPFAFGGTTAAGRVFSKIGAVVWFGGAVILGWP